MPLNTGVYRNGKRRTDLPWNGGKGNLFERGMRSEYLLNCFLTVGMIEGDPDLVITESGKAGKDLEPGTVVRLADTGVYYIDTKSPLWKVGKLVLKQDHSFGDEEERIEFKAGDELRMWRS